MIELGEESHIEPVKRVRDLPHNRQCLRYPGFECNCSMADEKLRRTRLRELREKIGAYSFLNLTDPGVAEANDRGRREFCEGTPPPAFELVKYRVGLFFRRLRAQIF